jgi:hypothetical protein
MCSRAQTAGAPTEANEVATTEADEVDLMGVCWDLGEANWVDLWEANWVDLWEANWVDLWEANWDLETLR